MEGRVNKQFTDSTDSTIMNRHVNVENIKVFTSLLLGKNQHITPARQPTVIPSTNSTGPRNMLNIRLPKINFIYKQVNILCSY